MGGEVPTGYTPAPVIVPPWGGLVITVMVMSAARDGTSWRSEIKPARARTRTRNRECLTGMVESMAREIPIENFGSTASFKRIPPPPPGSSNHGIRLSIKAIRKTALQFRGIQRAKLPTRAEPLPATPTLWTARQEYESSESSLR